MARRRCFGALPAINKGLDWNDSYRNCTAWVCGRPVWLAVLLQRELASIVDEDLDGLAERLAQREAALIAREAELADVEKGLAGREAEVAVRERRLAAAERRAQARPVSQPPPKLGRNEPCWCGSGKKYKHCHG